MRSVHAGSRRQPAPARTRVRRRYSRSHERQRPVPDLGRLRAAFPGYHIAAAGELLTLSRFPIAETHKVDTNVLRTDIQLDAGLLSVYNVHIPAQYVRNDNPLTRDFYAQLHDRNTARKHQFT